MHRETGARRAIRHQGSGREYLPETGGRGGRRPDRRRQHRGVQRGPAGGAGSRIPAHGVRDPKPGGSDPTGARRPALQYAHDRGRPFTCERHPRRADQKRHDRAAPRGRPPARDHAFAEGRACVDRLAFQGPRQDGYRRAPRPAGRRHPREDRTARGGSPGVFAAPPARRKDGPPRHRPVEIPVEANIEGINQTQVNVDARLTFASALRSILRQDPDVVLVGEIRDQETAEMAMRAAMTGHLVLSTLHTNDAPSAITRLIDIGIARYLAASLIEGVIAQRLVRTICPHCKEKATPDPATLMTLRIPPEALTNVQFYAGKGCP